MLQANSNSMKVVGLMSGTSLDGLDIAYVDFKNSGRIEFELICSETIPYSIEWQQKLAQAFHLSSQELVKLDAEYGIWLGNAVLHFIREFQLKPDLIASHGHTIFHKPNEGYTLQIGSGKMLHSITQIPVVNNFRVQDVKLGGQGAPLVPIGDELLFSKYDFCLNLGGFSNVSWKENEKRLACDIGPCNILLNEICKRIQIDFDEDGNLAKQGKVISDILNKWNELDYYQLTAPKSLGREWFEKSFLSDVQNSEFKVNDLLATSIQHIVLQIQKYIGIVLECKSLKQQVYNILVTGGGTHNSYLIQKLRDSGEGILNYVIPDNNLIDFKEAMVFALLGYMRWNNETNVLASVTGADRDHSSGEIYK